MDWELVNEDDYTFAQATRLSALPGFRHCFTTNVNGGDVSFRTNPDITGVLAHRTSLCRYLGADIADLTMVNQVHGDTVVVVDDSNRGRGGASPEDVVADADALITNITGIVLGICVADCVPVIICDPVTGAIGLAHSGWRGTVLEIVPKTIALMQTTYGANPGDLVVAVGPSISGRCYEVGQEVVDSISKLKVSKNAVGPSINGRWMLDLPKIVMEQAYHAGVGRESLSVSPWCTHCDDTLFHSYRRDGAASGRNGVFIVSV